MTLSCSYHFSVCVGTELYLESVFLVLFNYSVYILDIHSFTFGLYLWQQLVDKNKCSFTHIQSLFYSTVPQDTRQSHRNPFLFICTQTHMTTKATETVSNPARYKKDTKEGKHVAFMQKQSFPRKRCLLRTHEGAYYYMMYVQAFFASIASEHSLSRLAGSRMQHSDSNEEGSRSTGRKDRLTKEIK